jgi:hypothetical protein
MWAYLCEYAEQQHVTSKTDDGTVPSPRGSPAFSFFDTWFISVRYHAPPTSVLGVSSTFFLLRGFSGFRNFLEVSEPISLSFWVLRFWLVFLRLSLVFVFFFLFLLFIFSVSSYSD